jgi:PKD repeat protein
MKLYVDGVLAGTNNQTDAQGYDGYWRVGGDNHWGCCSPFLDGTIDEAAVYSSVLSASTVAAHFTAGGGNVPNQPPTAVFTHSETGLTTSVNGSGSSDPDGSITSYAWDFGDNQTGTGAMANHTYGAAGTYTVSLTVTDNGGKTGTSSQPVTVTTPPPNQNPTASFTHSETGLTTSVDGSGSSDPDGSIASYAWNFGDNQTGTGATVNHAYGATGTYTVSLTVTDNLGATSTTSQQVSVTAPPADPAYAKDAFERTAVNGWGTADLGGAWTVSGTLSRWSVSGGAGRVTSNAGNSATASLPITGNTDTEMAGLVSADKAATGSGQYISLITRRVSSTVDYRGNIRIASNGTVVASVSKMVSGTETLLAPSVTLPALTMAAGDKLRVRSHAVGTSPTTLRLKVWKDGTPEPSAWSVTASDSTAGLQAAGGVALYAYLSSSATNGPVVFSLDDVWVGPSRL